MKVVDLAAHSPRLRRVPHSSMLLSHPILIPSIHFYDSCLPSFALSTVIVI